MSHEPPMTFRGALQILGHDDQPWLRRLDVLLGGAILAAGVAGAAWGAPLFGAALLAALWSSVDQKNEAMSMLRSGLAKLSGRLAKTAPYERAELVAAAHTTLVVSSYFEVLHERLDAAGLRAFRIKDSEMKSLASSGLPRETDGVLDRILAMGVPAPSATIGYWENQPRVSTWCSALSEAVRLFLSGLQYGQAAAAVLDDELVENAVARYSSRYVELAAEIPEFEIWASFGEHAATRETVREMGSAVGAALAGHSQSFARIEALLGLVGATVEGANDPRARLNLVNTAVLDQPVFRAQTGVDAGGVRFPLIRNVHLNPRYRVCRIERGQSRPGDERWWDDVPVRPDLDLCLTAHFVSTEATRRPLLLLGHPGAGKSMLTKVLAARLPMNAYTVVRVPLRSVKANGRVAAQIQEALERATNDAVQWRSLADQSRDAIRVVLLDGLDELLQATPDDRTTYLEDVAEFQETEARLRCPVAVVVTSRTVVADRVEIPDGTVVVKLEDFDDDQVGYWLDEWAHTNGAGVAAGTVRALSRSSALGQPELARQPLLLLMLALYAADPQNPELAAGVSTTELYRRLFDVFARREIGNRATPPKPLDRDQAVREQLDRLSVAALAMFNRGRQHVTGAELAADLVSLGMAQRDVPSDTLPGQRLLGEFFFVHIAEAQTKDEQRRAYEFLHATFGEYLVARRIVGVLAETAEQTYSGSYGRREPDDNLLFALLSHQSLAVGKPILHFVRGLLAYLEPKERDWVPQLLDLLLSRYRQRVANVRFLDYRPLPVDHLREMAAYSANLALLRTAANSATAIDKDSSWTSAVALWKAGLDADGWQATVAALEPAEVPLEIAHARLIGDSDLERVLRYGLAATAGVHYSNPDEAWYDTVVTAVLPDLLSHEDVMRTSVELPEPTPETSKSEVEVALWIVGKAVRLGRPASPLVVQRVVPWFAKTSRSRQALAIFAHWTRNPDVWDLAPDLHHPEIYSEHVVAWAPLYHFAPRNRLPGSTLWSFVRDIEVKLPKRWRGMKRDVLAEVIATSASPVPLNRHVN
ncbi:NACHT domain-containing protein [Dactylosporangium sp. CS-033363]|uniref:NACHT domain-containing protein n=1 Tax=Dactylosporangium sp. CS-033363 TaxID=3239935 RepID=UPI003D8EBB68